MFLRLTDINGNLIVINLDKVCDFSLETYKGKQHSTVKFVDGSYLFVQESVSSISLLLQDVGKVIK